MKAKTKLTKLLSIMLALVMVVGMLPTTALAEEPDAFLQFIKAPGEIFYRNDGANDSDGPTVDTTFTLTEPTMITGIWTYHCNVADYDIDFSKQTIQLKDTATDTVVYSGAVRVGHYYNTIDCDWLVIPNIVLPAGTYQLIDSHHDSWSALNKKGVCAVKGHSYTPSETADFSTDPTAALSFLNAAKTGTTYSTWDSDTNTLTLNGVNFETTAATAVRLPADSTIILNGVNTIKGGNSDSGDCYGIEGLGNLTIQGPGTLNVTSGTTSRTAYKSFGISAVAVTIKSGTVIAKGGTAQMTEDSMSGGIYGSNYITIEGGIVEATGGTAWRSCGFSIVALGNMYISGGTVTATGGTSTEKDSYGIYTAYSAYVNITGGSLIAKAGSAPYAKALPWEPSKLPAIYWWRSSDSGQYKKGSFNWGDVSTYVEIVNTEPITTYTVNVTNGTASPSQAAEGTTVTLTANAAPSGKVFDKWVVESGNVTLADATSATTTFTMPAEDVSVKATYHTNSNVTPTPTPTPTPDPTPTPSPTPAPAPAPSNVIIYKGESIKPNANGEYISKKAKKPSIKKLSRAKKAFKITWSKVSSVTGYQVQYSTSKKFTKKTSKKITFKGNKKFTKTISKLKGGKKYYVRVRTYKTVKINGKATKIYSSWSKVKYVTTKK